MRAITLWQPWAWAIVTGKKTIENRPWKPWPDVIGQEVAIHAGAVYDPDGTVFLRERGVVVPENSIVRRAIIGTARILEYVEAGQLQSHPALQDPMFFGPFGWVLADARMLADPVPCKGALGLWRVPGHLLDDVRAGGSS